MRTKFEESYPDCIMSLPKAKISLLGVQGWVAQGEEFQMVFFEIELIGSIPPHSHKAQFGIVLEGEMMLKIVDEISTSEMKRGEFFYCVECDEHFHADINASRNIIHVQQKKMSSAVPRRSA